MPWVSERFGLRARQALQATYLVDRRDPRLTPQAVIGSFGVMYLLGFSLNNLSLMALTISTGFVVDDAIVVLENISRYLEQGMGRVEAAIRSHETGAVVEVAEVLDAA